MAALVDDFLRNVLKSGLLDREHLQEALRSLPRYQRERAEAIADHLVRLGKLTSFQAQKLLQGVAAGLVLGSFQLQAPLGKGGMGMVYLALDKRRGQHVALKILSPRKARAEDRYLARFMREIELSRRLKHPHIALTLDSGVSRGIYYIALEYIPGQTLFRTVVREGPLLVPRAARLFAEVASALDYAHGLGLVHRDLKPSNLMITPHDRAKVLDLGLAFRVGDEIIDAEVANTKGVVLGSIDYMSPEQTVDASAVDGRADLYSLGCCLYFALTGKPPFPAGSIRDKVNSHRNIEPTLVQNRNPDVPGAFAALVHRLLAKDPAQRFASALELEAALKPWCQPWDAGPAETQGDPAFEDAVRHAMTDWPEGEPATEGTTEHLIFNTNSDDVQPIVHLNYPPPNPDFETKNELWWLAWGSAGIVLFFLLLKGLFSLL